MTILEILSYLGAVALVVVVVWSFVVMILGPGILTSLNNRCDRYSAACGADVGFLIPLLSVALASAIFLFYRLRHVTSPVVKRAKKNPQDLVETAPPDIGEIVGRDELCRVIMEDIHHSDTRRPHLLVGGVGAGKTAVLVRLTRLLAERHAVPVPIRLRDATDDLNFRKMAHDRFLAMAESSMLSADEAEKVWRQLSKDDKIVVIADGLEEALTEGSASVHQDRDNLIRLAIHRARELRLPLIIASRPHNPLRGADATILELEPLSEEAALEYIHLGQDSVDARWLDWIVETAGLTELPLYLQITRQLSRRDRLDYLSADAVAAVAAASPRAARVSGATATTSRPGPVRAPARSRTSSGTELGSDVRSIRDVLLDCAARAKDDVKNLDLYAAVLEIDSFLDKSRHEEIARSVAVGWENLRGGDQRTLDEAKLGLVFRFGDAVRTVSDRPTRGFRKLDPAYRELLEMGRNELSYPIRLAIAQEIGAGGDEAFRILRQRSNNANGITWANTAWPNGTANAKTDGTLSRNERNRIPKKGHQDGRSEDTDKNRTLRGRTLCAWLTPLLVGSADKFGDDARQELGLWLDHVGRDQEGNGNHFPLSLEVALAQGFKYAANRRFRHPHALPATRGYMAEQAMEMLKQARFWFTQLTLIHALCLWEMPDPGMSRQDTTGRRGNGDNAAERRGRRHGSDPAATVGYWLEVARNGRHPFVAEAGKLAVEALKTGHPERFLWIDESGIVASVGSRAAQATQDRKHHLWIPPSAGWAVLDPRAQQLVADVLLLLNLAERGEGPDEIEQRLGRVGGSDLPLCFTHDRDPLHPETTVGGLYRAPGSNCIDGCRHRLCPYPPDGVQTYRSELSEAFCRGQQTLLTRGLSAPWQTILRAELKRFWAQMADRARGVSTDHDLD